MATHHIPILGASVLPDSSGSVFLEPASVKATTEVFNDLVWVFSDTATRIGLHGSFVVPQNYVGTAVVKVYWYTSATAGDVEWDFDYRAVAAGELLDSATVQETVNQNDTAEGTAFDLAITSLTLTGGNFAVGDLVRFALYRDGTDAGDTLAAAAVVDTVLFQYADA